LIAGVFLCIFGFLYQKRIHSEGFEPKNLTNTSMRFRDRLIKIFGGP